MDENIFCLKLGKTKNCDFFEYIFNFLNFFLLFQLWTLYDVLHNFYWKVSFWTKERVYERDIS